MAPLRDAEIHDQDRRRRPHSPSHHFFKIILPPVVQQKKLRIPDKFVKKFGDELSDVVNFMIPNGLGWKVGLTRAENGIWFDDGWDDFAQHNSISVGYFLLFGYKGFSNFSVLIFDKSACEINYTCSGQGSIYGEKCSEPCEIEMDSNGAIASPSNHCSSKRKVFDESPATEGSGERHAGQQNSGIKKQCGGVGSMVSPRMNTRSRGIMKQDVEEEVEINDSDTDESKREKFNERRRSSSQVQHHDNESLDKHPEATEIITCEIFECINVSPESGRAIEAARMSKPKNPSFMVLLQPRNFIASIVYVPIRFARRYLSRVLDSIKLKDSDGKEWSIDLDWKADGRVDLAGAWYVLFREHQLKEGDVCVFELIKKDALKISTFFANKSVDNCKEYLEVITSEMFGYLEASPESKRAIEGARMLMLKNPSFMVLLQPYNLYCNVVYVPAEFGKRYWSGISKAKNMKLEVISDGKRWEACLNRRENGKLQLGKGWNKFYRDNKLKGGDVCVFELINDNGIKVSIFHAHN